MGSWTLTELVGIAARALAVNGVRVGSGRVADVPNERLVRWYSTIGLVDRPTIGRGRTARYGERQLAQVVAVKRLQAQGLPLVEIQQRLVGATDAELRRVAGLPDDLAEWVAAQLPDGSEQTYLQKGRQHRPDADGGNPEADLFATPAGPVSATLETGLVAPGSAPAAGVAVSPVEQAPLSTSRLSADSDDPAPLAGSAERTPFWETRPTRVTATPMPVFGVTLSGFTLLLPAQPNQADLDAIASAAVPLIDLLASRGLVGPKGSHQ